MNPEEIRLKNVRIIDASSSVAPLGPSKKVKAAVRKAVKHIRRFSDHEALKLIKLLVSKYRISEDGVLFASSIDELVYRIPAVFQPRRVLIIGPALRMYEKASFQSGAEITYVTSDEYAGFFPNYDLIYEKLKDADLLFMANPNRISGRCATRDTLFGLISYALSRGVRVIMDESLIEFTVDDTFSGDSDVSENLITLRTTAFFYGLPGLELAFAVGSPSTIKELKKRIHGTINYLALVAAETALKDKTYKKITRKFVHDEKKRIFTHIEKLKGIEGYDSDTNVLLIKLEEQERRLFEGLNRAGFAMKDCKDIEGLNRQFMRLSVMSHEYNKKFLRVLTDCL